MTTPDPTADLARANPVLSRLSDAARRELLSGSLDISIAPSEALVRQGQASDAAYLVLAGELDVQVETA